MARAHGRLVPWLCITGCVWLLLGAIVDARGDGTLEPGGGAVGTIPLAPRVEPGGEMQPSSLVPEWSREWGGPGSDRGQDLATCPDGCIVTCGSTTSYGAGSQDALLVKYDPAGKQLWNRTWGSSGSDRGKGVAVGPDGSIYMVGVYCNIYSIDAFIVKYSRAGTLNWSRTYGSTHDDAFFDVVVDIHGDVVATGYMWKYGSFTPGYYQMMCVKYSSSGTYLKSMTFSPYFDYDVYWLGMSIASVSGDFYVFGFQYIDYVVVKAFLIRYDNAFNQIWAKYIMMKAPERLLECRTNMFVVGNSIYVACQAWNYVKYYGYGYLLAYTFSGVQAWNRTFGGVYDATGYYDDFGFDVTPTPSGFCMVLGPRTGNISLVEFDASWNEVSNRTLPGTGNHSVASIGASEDAVYLLTDRHSPDSDLCLSRFGISSISTWITRPADTTCTYGLGGADLAWTITGTGQNGTAYAVLVDGMVAEAGSWSSGVPVHFHVDGLAVGPHDITIVASDGLGGAVQDAVVVIVLPNDPPSLTRPGDLSYVIGQQGNVISWIVTDASVVADVGSYAVICNGQPAGSGTWRDGSSIPVIVDGLALGPNNVTVSVEDGINRAVQDSVVVTVLPNDVPAVTCTVDVEAASISWHIVDVAYGKTAFTVYCDGDEIASGNWTSGQDVNVSFGGLPRREHVITIVIDDGLGGNVSSSVVVDLARAVDPVMPPPPAPVPVPEGPPPGAPDAVGLALVIASSCTIAGCAVIYRKEKAARRARSQDVRG